MTKEIRIPIVPIENGTVDQEALIKLIKNDLEMLGYSPILAVIEVPDEEAEDVSGQ